MNFGGFSWLAIASFYFLFEGLWKLVKIGKYKEFIIISSVAFGPLLVIWYLLQIAWDLPTGLQRLWFSAPWITIGILWLLSGFFIRKQVDAILNNSPSPFKNTAFAVRKMARFSISIGTIFLSICFWLYGVGTPPNGPYFFIGLPAITAGFLFGILGLIPDSAKNDQKQQ